MSTNTEPVGAKATIQFEDGQKMCTPSKLPPDTQRILTILESCISKVEIVAILGAFLQSNCLSSVVDETFRRALQKLLKLVENLELQVGPKQKSDKKQKGKEEKSSMEAKYQLEKDIKLSVKNLLRYIRDHPDVIGLKEELDLEIEESELSLISELRKFQSHVSEKLQGVEEEPEPAHCEQVSPSTVANVEDEDTYALKKLDEMILKKNCEIESLQSRLEKISKEPAKTSLLDERRKSIISTMKMKESSLQKVIDELKTKLNDKYRENIKAERELRAKIDKVKSEISEVIQNFDDKMEELQAKLELNEFEYKKEQEELKVLQERFSVLEMECNRIQEELLLAQENNNKEREEMIELEMTDVE